MGTSAGKPQTAEQEARDILERMGMEGAQSFSAGDVIELANLIAERDRLRDLLNRRCPKCAALNPASSPR